MAKLERSYMVRRGKKYLIERTAEGTFGRFVPVSEVRAERTGNRANKVNSQKTSAAKRVAAADANRNATQLAKPAKANKAGKASSTRRSTGGKTISKASGKTDNRSNQR